MLIMAERNETAVLEMPGVENEQIYLLHEYAAGTTKNVADPYGESVEVYEATAVEIEEAAGEVIAKVAAK